MKLLGKDIIGVYIAKGEFKVNKDISHSEFKELLTNRSIIKPPYFSHATNEESVLKMSFSLYLDFYAMFNGFDWSNISVCFICSDGSIIVDNEDEEYKFISTKILYSYQGGLVSGFNISNEKFRTQNLVNIESDEIDFTDF